MKRFHRILMLFSALALLSSCSTVGKLFTSPSYEPVEESLCDLWYGRPASELLEAYGIPDRQMEDGLGGSIFVYEEVLTEYAAYNGGTGLNHINTQTKALTYRNFTEFYLDQDLICYNVQSNRLEENGRKFSPLKTLGITALLSGLIFGVIAVI